MRVAEKVSARRSDPYQRLWTESADVASPAPPSDLLAHLR